MGGVILNFDRNLQSGMALLNQNVSGAVSANLHADKQWNTRIVQWNKKITQNINPKNNQSHKP